MDVAICGFVSTVMEKLSWLYQQRQWSRQELLLIVLGLSILLLILLRRRRLKSARAIHPEQFADYSSVIGAKLAEHRHSRRYFVDSRKALAASVSMRHDKSQKVGKPGKQEPRSDTRSGRSSRQGHLTAQWDIAKPRPSGGAPRPKLPERVAVGERLYREAAEGRTQESAGQTRDQIASPRGESAASLYAPAPAVTQAPSLSSPKSQTDGALVQKIDELTAANTTLLHEAQEHKQAQERFEQKLAELTTANEQLQKQVGELSSVGAKRRVYTYEDEHRVVEQVRQKLCRKCGQWKDESEFHKNASRKDGLARWCKICKIGAARKSRARRATPNE